VSDDAPRKRGRPRKYPPKAAKTPLSAAQRSDLGRAAWKSRPPKYERTRGISLRPDAFAALNSKRGEQSWSDFLCRLAGIDPPPDRRHNAPPSP